MSTEGFGRIALGCITVGSIIIMNSYGSEISKIFENPRTELEYLQEQSSVVVTDKPPEICKSKDIQVAINEARKNDGSFVLVNKRGRMTFFIRPEDKGVTISITSNPNDIIPKTANYDCPTTKDIIVEKTIK